MALYSHPRSTTPFNVHRIHLRLREAKHLAPNHTGFEPRDTYICPTP